jgi:phage terminase large subunit-like protein
MRDHVALANQYIADVLDGKIITNRWVKLACQRQRDDLARTDFPYFFDPQAATDVCSFLEVLTHVKGRLGGLPFILEPFQCFIVCTLFGWKRKDQPHLRRFRRSFTQMGKANGKSFISSGLAAYMLACDGEPGSEVLCVARAKNQAQVVFDTTREILRANPKVCELFDIRPLTEMIMHGTTCTMRPATNQSKSLAGTLPHFIVADETWSWASVELLEECERAIDKRDNSMLSTITHAASDLSSVGHQQYETACAVLTGELVDERSFSCMWSSEGYPWTSDEAIQAANPCLGISVYEDTLKEARDRAIKVPALQVAYRAKNLCEWIGSDITWLDPEKLAACREKNLKMADYRLWHCGEPGVDAPDRLRPFTVGLDLSKRTDLCCVCYVTMAYRDGKEHFFAWVDSYLPEATIANSPIAKYRTLAACGNIISMPGPTNDLDEIQRQVLAKYRRRLGYGAVENPNGFNIVMAAYDSWQANQMAGNLERAGISSIPFEKTAKYYSPTMEWLAALILEGRFHFPAESHALLWAFSNIVVHRDRNENIFPNKPDPDRKIDPAISCLYALRAAMSKEGNIMRIDDQGCPRVSFIFEDGSSRSTDARGNLGESVPVAEEPKP